MPRNGSNVYSKAAGTTAVSGTTVESAKYNAAMDDLVTDQNTARPIAAGGTGATTAAAALAAFGGMAKSANLTDLADIPTARINLELVPVTSATDTTAGSLLTPGSYGWGATVTPPTLADLSAFDTPAGMYVVTAATPGKPADMAGNGIVIFTRRASGACQEIVIDDGGQVFTRSSVGSVWRSWERMIADSMKATKDGAEAGANNATYMTPLRTAEARNATAIGWGQTWQDMLATRAHSTSYQNTTGRPITVAINGQYAGGRPLEASADDVTWIDTGIRITNVTTGSGGSAIIPVGWFYRVNGSCSIYAWSELR